MKIFPLLLDQKWRKIKALAGRNLQFRPDWQG
jgi:hypothetical protein